MKRLSFIALFVATMLVVASTIYFQTASSQHRHDNRGATNATVSFGGWMSTPVLDRFPNSSPIAGNYHALTPKTVKIKAGGTVNFVIAGFHNVVVYDDGTRPEHINVNMTITPTNGGPPLINDPNRRIYRGLDPSLQSQDRVEVVQFDRPGLYLVICAVRPHFVNDAMYGYVRVLPNNRNDNDDDNE